jgi:PAS domain S-box-containing protein
MNTGQAQEKSKLTEGALPSTAEQAKLLIEAVQDYAIFMLNRDGYIVSWNIGAERIKGYKAHEIIGKHFSVFYPQEDVAWGKPAWELEVASKEGRFEDENWRLRKDGSRFWANVIITAVRDASGNLIGFGKVTRDVTDKMKVERALEHAQRRLHESERSLRQLSVHLLRMQDQERQRIGRELHDSLGQYLSVLKMKLDSVDFSGESATNAAQNDISECAGLAETCIREVRTISYLLFPPFLEERGLGAAIGWFLEGFTQRSGIQTTADISPDSQRLPADLELVLYRVLQEALTNVHRHSESPTAEVRLARNAESAVLEITDHGKGLPAEVLEESQSNWTGSRGVGLRGMNERVRQVGGTFDITSNGSGTTLRVSVPVASSLGDADAGANRSPE